MAAGPRVGFMLDLPIHHYCESGAFGAILHPLNVVSCAVFWFAALRVWDKRDTEDLDIHMFMALMLVIMGVTGMAWHWTGSWIAQALDIAAIYFTMTMAVITVAAGVLRLRLVVTLALVPVLIFASAWLRDSGIPFLPLNGGAFLPAFFFFAFAALRAEMIGRNVMVYMLCAASLLIFGLLFHSVDNVLCPYWQYGTHFIWHFCFAGSLCYVVKAYDERMKIKKKAA